MTENFDPVAWELGGLRGALIGPADAKYPSQSEGSSIRLRDGSFAHIFSRREKRDDIRNWHGHYAPTDIVQVLSRDGGRTWTEMQALIPGGSATLSNPSVVRLPNDELGLSYNRIEAVDLSRKSSLPWTKSVKNAVRVFRSSADEGRTWSVETVMTPSGGYWTAAHDRFLVLSSGRVLHPLHTIYSDFPEYKIGVRVAYSDDYGATWKLNDGLLTVEERMEQMQGERKAVFAEANIAEREDGTLLLIGRTLTGRQHYSFSADGGESWSDPVPSPVISPEAPARLVRVPDSSDLLLIWNSDDQDALSDAGVKRRLTLTTAISQDGGMTWKWQREFANIAMSPGTRVHYPSIYFDGSQVLVSYSAAAKIGELSLHQQYIAVMPLSWFYTRRGH
jgi:hypothetical protein